MAIIKFRDEQGRECEVPWPPKDLSEIEMLYRECGESATEKVMSEIVVGHDDVVEFGLLGVQATGRELTKHNAGARLVTFAKKHIQRHGGTFSEAMSVARRLNPEWAADYLNQYLTVAEEEIATGEVSYSQQDAVPSERTPAQEIAHRMGIVKREHPHMTATECRDLVLKKDVHLKALYSGSLVIEEYYENDD